MRPMSRPVRRKDPNEAVHLGAAQTKAKALFFIEQPDPVKLFISTLTTVRARLFDRLFQ